MADKIYDSLRGRSGKKNLSNSAFFQRGNIRLGNNSAYENCYVIHAFSAQQFHQPRAKRVVRAGKDRKADDVHVFLNRGWAIISGVCRSPV